jgi:uncharacterized phage protein gp47/JayE
MPSTPSLADLTVPQTSTQILERLKQLARDRGLPVDSWNPDDDARALLEIEAVATEDVWALVPRLVSLRSLETAEDQWLDWVARWDYGTPRNPATRTVREVVLRCSSDFGAYNIAPNQLWFTTSRGQRFNNTAGGTLAPSGTLAILCRAEFAGEETRYGAISEINTPLPGVTIDGQSILTIGTDEESDEALRNRARGALRSRGSGKPTGVYEQAARDAAPSISRVRVDQPRGAGTVDLVVAGIAPITTAMLDAVRQNVADRRSLCADVAVYAATLVVVNVPATLTVARDYRTSAEIDAPAALVKLAQDATIGESLPLAKLTAALMAVAGMQNVVFGAFAGVTLTRAQIASLVLVAMWVEV